MSVIDETLNETLTICINGQQPDMCKSRTLTQNLQQPAWETTSPGSQPSLWKSDFQEITALSLVTNPTSLTVTADNYFDKNTKTIPQGIGKPLQPVVLE